MDSYKGSYKIVPSSPPSSSEAAKRQWRKTTTVVAVICSTILLVAAIYVGVRLKDTHDGKNGHNPIRSLDLIEKVCNSTLYYDLCISSLSSYPGSLEANMSELARMAVEVSLDAAISVTNFVAELSKSAEEQSSCALEDCTVLLDDTVDQLNSSVSVLADKDWRQSPIDDLQASLSAALTNPSTCVEGFKDVGVIMDESMKQKIQNLTELVSNDLAVVNFVFASENVQGELDPWSLHCSSGIRC